MNVNSVALVAWSFIRSLEGWTGVDLVKWILADSGGRW